MLRTALAVVLPFAVLLPVVAPDLATILWKYGGASSTYDLYILSLSLFGIGVVFFTVHYLVLRGFYALERNRTVFLIQCAVAATNIVAAVVLVARTDAEHTAPALVVAYAASYVVGSVVSYLVLRRVLGGGVGGLGTPELVRFLVRLAIVTAVATAVALALALLLPGRDEPSHVGALRPAGRGRRGGRRGVPRAGPGLPAHRGDRRARHGDKTGDPESAADLTRSRTYDETSPTGRKGHGVARDPPR